jgi:hypothetical protein
MEGDSVIAARALERMPFGAGAAKHAQTPIGDPDDDDWEDDDDTDDDEDDEDDDEEPMQLRPASRAQRKNTIVSSA